MRRSRSSSASLSGTEKNFTMFDMPGFLWSKSRGRISLGDIKSAQQKAKRESLAQGAI
jgi:hypothetical protein